MKEKIQVILVTLMFLSLTAFAWFKPADDISDSELRKLAQFPEINVESLLNGEFMKNFESYTLDQFPLRDDFRTIKAVTYLYGLGQLDNNGIYIEDDYAVKMEYPINTESLDHAIGIFEDVYKRFIEGSDANVYMSIVPDKNYFLADSHGALKVDYDELFKYMQNGMSFADYIDITGLLEKGDYYHTDTHWNQVNIADVADKLAEGMGTSLVKDYETVDVEAPFYGVYYGQAALPMKPDKMQYLTNGAIKNAKVFDWQNNKEIPVYDEKKMGTRSPYDIFLGGSLSLITIDNPEATSDKELVIFRDSFGSSISPLLISGYKKITILDIRYLPHERVGSFVKFNNQDVLFLYSALVLNNSTPLK